MSNEGINSSIKIKFIYIKILNFVIIKFIFPCYNILLIIIIKVLIILELTQTNIILKL